MAEQDFPLILRRTVSLGLKKKLKETVPFVRHSLPRGSSFFGNVYFSATLCGWFNVYA